MGSRGWWAVRGQPPSPSGRPFPDREPPEHTPLAQQEPPGGDAEQGRGVVDVRMDVKWISSENGRIPRGGLGLHLFGLIVFFVEPAVGIEPTTC